MRCLFILLPGSIQVACYLAVYLVLWGLFGAIWGMGVSAAYRTYWFDALADLTHVDRELLSTMA